MCDVSLEVKGFFGMAAGLLILTSAACGATPASHASDRTGVAPTPSPSPLSTPYVAPKSPPSSFPPCVPSPTPSPGINAGPVQVGPDSYDVFVTSDHWIGPKPGSSLSLYQVFAGVTGDAATQPGVPAVWVKVITFSGARCSTTGTNVGEFLDTSAGGTLTITSVVAPIVYLRSGKGTALTFDLVTHRFATAHVQPGR
jgi:hypothetical protein